AHHLQAGQESHDFHGEGGPPPPARDQTVRQRAGGWPAARRELTRQATVTVPAIERVDVSAYRIPTDAPESDGTLRWDSTTLVLVEAGAGGVIGLGYSYTHEAAATVVEEL